jgi:UDP-N-acetyl-D-glucosamine dehydrogenase
MHSEALTKLASKLSDKSFTLGVIGLGYVGIPLSLTFLRKGVKVIGFDLDPFKISKIEQGQSYIKHIPSEELAKLVTQKLFTATADFARLDEPDCLLICVPTPLTANREPDLKYIEATGRSIAKVLRPGQMIVLESTTYPGTTVEVLQPLLEQSGLQAGVDFALAFSPEREDPGNPNFGTANIPKVVGGIDPSSSALAQSLYAAAMERVVPVSTTQAAEMTKLLENIHRSVNIGLVNEMKIICDKMGIDIYEVIRAAATKPFGFTAYYPGPGLGGHCIPIDPFYLTWKAREYGVTTRFIELAGEVNTSMPRWVIGKVVDALNEQGKSIKGSRILVLGIAYKKNVDDMRESPSVELMEILREKGAMLEYSDPYFPIFPKMRHHCFDLNSVALRPETVAGFDLILLATNHDAFDYEMLKENARLIVDTRGVYQAPANNIVKA